MVELNAFMSTLADEIDGQYSEYNKEKAVIIVPLEQHRFQAVLGSVRKGDHANGFQFTSKVCEYHDKLDLKELLKKNNQFTYAKFVIIEDVIKVQATVNGLTAEKSIMKEMIFEVAKAADEWEYKLTGMDVN